MGSGVTPTRDKGPASPAVSETPDNGPLVTLRQGAKPEEVDAFLAERVHLLGFSKEALTVLE